MRHILSTIALCLLFLGWAPPSAAQGAPIRIVVPSPAGGLSDGLARALAVQLRALTGETYVIENKPGASTAIGMRECGIAKPDGRTYCITLADSLSFNPHAFATLPYDPEKFIGVAHLGSGTGIIFAHSGTGFTSYKDALAAAKQKPGQIFLATFGDASRPDIVRRWTNLKAGVEIAGVPYKGFAPATQALVAGEIQLGYMGVGQAKDFVASGVLKPLAIVGKTRLPVYPSVPSLDELGLDMDLTSYFGLYAPPGTPADVVSRMHSMVHKAMESDAMKKFSETHALERVNMTQPQFDQFVRNDRRHAGEVFKSLGIKPGVIPQ
jgi:tripartite-type tricarboxylate transporter receptor subunit TctC